MTDKELADALDAIEAEHSDDQAVMKMEADRILMDFLSEDYPLAQAAYMRIVRQSWYE